LKGIEGAPIQVGRRDVEEDRDREWSGGFKSGIRELGAGYFCFRYRTNF